MVKLSLKNENKKATLTIALFTALVIATVATPITTALSKTTEIVVEKFFEDESDRREKEVEIDGKELENESKRLKNEEQRLKNEKIKQELKDVVIKIDSNQKIKKYKSNFYEEIEKEKRIQKILFAVEDNYRLPISKEHYILQENCKEYILPSNEIETEPIEDAVIEIISPVLKKGNYKWKGIYNNNAISFDMKSNEFKTLIQTGKIEFKNGSAINCVLNIKKELDNDGNEKIIAYNILSVNHYFENEKPVETPERKKQRKKREANENQLNIFGNES